MALKRPQSGAAGGNGCSVSVDLGGWSKSLPSLARFLSEVAWEDGTSRQTGTAMLLCEDGAWKVWLHERALGLTAFISSSTPDKALQTADKQLELDQVAWRADRKPGPGPNKSR